MANPEVHLHRFKTLHSIRIPRVMRAVGWMLFTGIAVLAAFLVFVPWVQTTSGAGTVIALNPNDRVQQINALVSGRIQEWFVRDGTHVAAGDPIVQIVDNDPLLIERLQEQRAQARNKLDSVERAKATAEIDRERMSGLLENGLVARRDYELSRIKVEGLGGDAAEAAAALNRIEVSLSRQSVQIVRAPRNGVILRANSGDAATVISTGDAVATFVPDNAERAVEIDIDGRDVALVTPGAKARLQFEGWPAVQFSGWPSVSVGTFGAEVLSIDPSANRAGRFRVLLVVDEEDAVPWPDDRFVRYGAKVRGWIQLDTVRAGFEVWRQLNNFPPNLVDASASGAISE